MPIWAIHPKPFEGELFSSWLVRIAEDCGMTVSSFCSLVASIKNVNIEKLDYYSNDSLLRILSEGTNTPVKKFREMLLLSETVFAYYMRSTRFNSWLMSRSSVRSLRAVGMFYCPECLRTDDKPYYRKNWLYAHHAICLTHRIPLQDYCPHCNHRYAHTSLSQTPENIAHRIAICWFCRKKVYLDKSSKPWGGHLIDRALTTQKNFLAANRQEAIHVPGYGYMEYLRWKRIMRMLVDSLVSGTNEIDHIDFVSRLSGIEYQVYRHKSKPCDKYDIGYQAIDRAIELSLASWLMEEWPTRVISYSERLEIRHKDLFGKDFPLTFGYSEFGNDHFLHNRHEVLLGKRPRIDIEMALKTRTVR